MTLWDGYISESRLGQERAGAAAIEEYLLPHLYMRLKWGRSKREVLRGARYPQEVFDSGDHEPVDVFVIGDEGWVDRINEPDSLARLCESEDNPHYRIVLVGEGLPHARIKLPYRNPIVHHLKSLGMRIKRYRNHSRTFELPAHDFLLGELLRFQPDATRISGSLEKLSLPYVRIGDSLGQPVWIAPSF